MSVIDSHIHLFQRPYTHIWPNSHVKFGPEGEAALSETYRQAYDIEAAFVVGYQGAPWTENNAYIGALAAERPWILPFGYLEPDPERAPAIAQQLDAQGFFGASCYCYPHSEVPEWLGAPSMDALWTLLQECNLPLSLNIAAAQCGPLGRALARFPQMTVIVSHMGRPQLLEDGRLDERNYGPLLALARFERVYIKLSGFYAFVPQGWRYPQRALFPVVDRLRAVFGIQRLLFGSDFAPVLEHNSYRQALELLRSEYGGFAEPELSAIYGANARRIIAWRQEAQA